MGCTMSQVEVERFPGRIITAADFRKAVNALKKVCSREGITLSPEELLLVCKADFAKFGLAADVVVKRS